MIPLNRPGKIKQTSDDKEFVACHFQQRNVYIVSTASDALNIVYRKLYEEKGALRIGVSPLACYQAIYPILLNGHTPVFLDVDPNSFNLDVSKLFNRDDIQALEVIHLGGNPNEMDAIQGYIEERHIPMVEDCAQALGSMYNGQYLGNFGDFASFSLIKNLHVSSGGLFVSKFDMTNDIDKVPIINDGLRNYRKVKIWLESKANHHKYNAWNYFYYALLRLKGAQSSFVGSSSYKLKQSDNKVILQKLSYFDELFNKRIENAKQIIDQIDVSRASIQNVPIKGSSNRNRILLRLKNNNSEYVIKKIRKKGIAANNLTQNYMCGYQAHISKDFLLGKYYQNSGLDVYNSIYNKIIAIPSSPFLTKKEINHIINTVNDSI